MQDKNSIFKWIIFATLVAASVVFMTPPKDKIRLGLDLAGGTSFTVQIDQEQLRSDLKAADAKRSDSEIQAQIDTIMANADDRTIEVIRNRIDGLGVNEPLIVPGKDHRIIIEIPGADEKQREIAEKSIRSAAYLQFRLVHPKNYELTRNLINDGKVPEGYEMVEDAISGQSYYARVKNYEKLLRDPDYKRRLAQFGNPDPGYSFMLELNRLRDGREVYSPAFVRNREEMNGDELRSATISVDSRNGGVGVSLSFTKEGARQFGKLTSDYAPNGNRNKSAEGRQLAIVLDGTLYSAPVIRTPITDGRAEITGSFTRDDAAQLRNVLNAGSLPAPITVLEKRMIDPSLGSDAIRSGMRASMIGGILIVVFMAIYYGILGIVADIALALNIILLPLGAIIISGFFSAVGATDSVSASRTALQLPVLTMPGIAGIVLTVGMAVDANVLIFERVREELKQGKSTLAAILAGYDRAFLAIFDSNLTTFLTAIILFIFGSGPIRGFAITLSAGIIVSMYTALVVTRMILRLCTKETSKAPKIMDWFTFPNLDFVGMGRLAMTISAVIIVVTLGIFAVRCKTSPREVLAIDFTGGTVMSYTFEKQPEIGDMRVALKAGGIDDAIIQSQKSADGTTDSIQVKSGYDKIGGGVEIGKAITDTLKKAFPDSGMQEIGQDTIGSQIGEDLKRDATKAVIIALIGMLIYISIRFEFGFALGAVVALLHDVLITLGLFTLFGRQIGVTAIACFLTIVGYSVNDTIVISDRIREDLKKNKDLSFRDLCNRSIVTTLGRTVLTSLTTLLAVLSLLIFGGGAIFDFALCMTIGVIAGVYSTIFIATPVMLAWYKGRRPGMAKKDA